MCRSRHFLSLPCPQLSWNSLANRSGHFLPHRSVPCKYDERDEIVRRRRSRLPRLLVANYGRQGNFAQTFSWFVRLDVEILWTYCDQQRSTWLLLPEDASSCARAIRKVRRTIGRILSTANNAGIAFLVRYSLVKGEDSHFTVQPLERKRRFENSVKVRLFRGRNRSSNDEHREEGCMFFVLQARYRKLCTGV